jgi:hypothetical protein
MNPTVSKWLLELHHPMLREISMLRSLLFDAEAKLYENIKWNGPNYVFQDLDRISMKIHPAGKIQLIFHCGSSSRLSVEGPVLQIKSRLIQWKGNNRAILSIHSLGEIKKNETFIKDFVIAWLTSILISPEK